MAVNGSEFIDQPFNTSYSPFIDLFEGIVGNGYVFFLIPVIVLTYGIYIKTDKNTIMASLFMITSGALLSGGGIFTGAHDIAIAFTLFTAFGFVALFTSILFMKK